MKQCLFLFLMLSQFSLNAQKKKLPWNFRTSLEVNQLRTIGGSFSIHPTLSKYFSLGAGADLIRVRDISKNVVPVYLDVSFKFPVKEFEPFLFLQGGLNAYNNTFSNTTFNTKTEISGRSFLGTGAGFTVGNQSAKMRLFWAFKYRVYRFSETLISENGNRTLTGRPEKDQYSFSIGIVY